MDERRIFMVAKALKHGAAEPIAAFEEEVTAGIYLKELNAGMKVPRFSLIPIPLNHMPELRFIFCVMKDKAGTHKHKMYLEETEQVPSSSYHKKDGVAWGYSLSSFEEAEAEADKVIPKEE